MFISSITGYILSVVVSWALLHVYLKYVSADVESEPIPLMVAIVFFPWGVNVSASLLMFIVLSIVSLALNKKIKFDLKKFFRL